jgi:mannose-1-phosphate guanylyltransferase
LSEITRRFTGPNWPMSTNRGTTAAFFPADHHFVDEQQFAHAVNRAFEVAYKHPDLLVLLGARAEKADVEYGWIEPGSTLDGEGNSSLPVFRVKRFWEKPTAATAEALLGLGCLYL